MEKDLFILSTEGDKVIEFTELDEASGRNPFQMNAFNDFSFTVKPSPFETINEFTETCLMFNTLL